MVAMMVKRVTKVTPVKMEMMAMRLTTEMMVTLLTMVMTEMMVTLLTMVMTAMQVTPVKMEMMVTMKMSRNYHHYKCVQDCFCL